MLDEREDIFADAVCGSLESVAPYVAPAYKLLFFFASRSIKESSGAF